MTVFIPSRLTSLNENTVCVKSGGKWFGTYENMQERSCSDKHTFLYLVHTHTHTHHNFLHVRTRDWSVTDVSYEKKFSCKGPLYVHNIYLYQKVFAASVENYVRVERHSRDCFFLSSLPGPRCAQPRFVRITQMQSRPVDPVY